MEIDTSAPRTTSEKTASALRGGRDTAADIIDRFGERLGGALPFGDGVADRAKQAAHSAAEYVRHAEVGDLVDDVRRYAKSHPGPMLLGAIALGFVAGRMLRRG